MNRKIFSLVISLAILSSSLSPTWAAGDFTYNNINQNLPIKAPVSDPKEAGENIDLPLVTETLPDESVRSKYTKIIFIPETKKVDGVMQYGKLLDKEGKEVGLRDISYNNNVVKGKEYYALKSASWREVKNYKENDKQVLFVRGADNNEINPEKKEIHKFLTWKLGSRKVFPFYSDYKLKLEGYSINKPVIFKSVFEPLPYFYSISHLDSLDADGYKLTNSSDEYYSVEFLSSGGNKEKGVGFRFNDSQIKNAYKEANNSKNVVLHIRWNSGDYGFGDYKPQTVNIKDRTFWYWTYDKNSHQVVKDDTKLSISRPTFIAKYIVDYLGIENDFDLQNNPIPEGCHELKLEAEDGYSFNSVPYEKFAVRDGLSLAFINSIQDPILKDKNNNNYEGEVDWYDGYKKIDSHSEFKINSDIVLTARRVRDFQSEKFIPEVKEIEVNKDEDVTLKKLKSGVVNLPEDIKDIEIVENVDTSKVGEGKATLKLIFTDTSSKEVEVPVKVIEKIAGGEITPIPTINESDIIKEKVPYNGQINLLDNIKNLPDGAEVEDISDPIDTKVPGTYKGKVKVIFKDGSSRIVVIPVKVSEALADSYTSQVKEIEINKDEDVTLEKLKSGIVNLPKNLDKIEIKTYPDTSEVGEGKATLKLIFTDTSSKEVEIPVRVIEKISGGAITPIPKINESDIIKEEVPYNGEINLLDNINNLPDGAEVQDISDPIDTKIPGTYTGKIKITFKDGSSRIVEIPIEVLTPMAEEFPVRNPVKTQVENLENINSTEKSEIEEKVREANPQVVSIEVDDRGNVTLIYEDGSSNLIKAEDVIILREKTPEEEEPEEKPGEEDNKDPEGTPGEEDEDPEGIPGEGDKNSEDKPGEVGDKDPEEKPGEKDNKDPEENPKDNEEEDNKKTDNKRDSWNDFPRYYARNHRTPTYKVETKVTYKESKPQVNSKKFVINMKTGTYTTIEDGKTLERSMEVKPLIKDDRTFLPLRALADILDAKVIWNEGTRTASFTREGLTALIQIDGKKIVLSSGETIELESKPLNINGRIYIPLVNLGQVFGLTSGNSLDGEDQDIEWDDMDKTVTINIK